MVLCDEPVPARELLLQSKLYNAPFSELVASKTLGSGTTYCSNDLFSNVHLNSPDCVYS